MLPSESGTEPSASANSVEAIFGKGFNVDELRISYWVRYKHIGHRTEQEVSKAS